MDCGVWGVGAVHLIGLEGESKMTAKEELHRLVDQLPASEWEHAKSVPEELCDDADDRPLSSETLASIERGLEDIRAGRTITLEELERKYGV